jgi:hypothetical protein
MAFDGGGVVGTLGLRSAFGCKRLASRRNQCKWQVSWKWIARDLVGVASNQRPFSANLVFFHELRFKRIM